MRYFIRSEAVTNFIKEMGDSIQLEIKMFSPVQ